MKTKILRYKIKFITPAFLGNAEQRGQWRTPPFKALLRQWWRVAYAAEVGYDVKKLRTAESRLFGSASDDGNGGSGKSRVRLRFISNWKNGTMEQSDWQRNKFKKVTTTRDGQGSVRSDVYLGFGAVLPPSRKQNRRNVELQSPPAISPDEEAVLEVRVDETSNMDHIISTIQLVHYFGSIGSRSRNGWGSLEMTPIDGRYPELNSSLGILQKVLLPLSECVKKDWPHAIGRGDDGRPLVWLSKRSFVSWHESIDFLAEVKVSMRRAAKRFSGFGIGGIHFLGYPAGEKWTVREWEGTVNEKQKRFACPVRFKVVRIDNNGLRVMIVHLPLNFPYELSNILRPEQRRWIENNQLSVWNDVHDVLDEKVGRLS